ncbi:phosphotransferase [Actinosynnema sp. NPDC050436]|uniref:phosphotransferase n=1 Tax=Actinosynnema sp. NPDC050436 TaxID=3155659 RepID=UPI0033F4B979
MIDVDVVVTALGRFGLAEEPVSFPDQGADNLTAFVGSGDQRYVLRCYGVTAADEIDFELDLVDHLVGTGFPVPAVVRTPAGGRRVFVGGVQAVLFDFAPGTAIDPSRPESAALVADLAARLHTATTGFTGGERSRSDEGRLRALLDALTDDPGLGGKQGADRLAGHVRELLGGLADLRAARLPSGAVHHDYHAGNVLVRTGDDGTSVSALLDFDESYAGPFVFDVAAVLTQWGRGDGDWFDVRVMRDLLGAYERVRPLTPGERAVLPFAVRVFTAADAAEYVLRTHRERPDAFELSECLSLDLCYALAERDDWLRGLDRG